MNTTPDTIEDEVLRDIEKPENPYKRYRVEFPFTCTFTIPEDGHNTRVTIETRSEHLHHAKSEDDVRLQLEKDREIDGPLNAKRILKFVRDEMWNVEPRDVSVTYHPDYIIELATPEKVQEIVEDFLDDY
jgi:hypothetical protein